MNFSVVSAMMTPHLRRAVALSHNNRQAKKELWDAPVNEQYTVSDYTGLISKDICGE